MYIEQVLSACDTFYPNPYTTEEKYFWCDELSELLTLKYNTQYVKSELFEVDGKYLLPEGVTASMIDSIICGDRVLKKQDFRSFGILCFDSKTGCQIVLPPQNSFKRVYAIYIEPYEKIRNVSFEGSAEFGADYFLIDENIFRAGDILKIEVAGSVFEDAFVLSAEPDFDSAKLKVQISGAQLPEGRLDCTIERRVTEKTVCQPPYDSMYIDYLLSKICYYQNDFSSCNNHLMLFNSKLTDYEKWLKSHPIVDYQVATFKNWW